MIVALPRSNLPATLFLRKQLIMDFLAICRVMEFNDKGFTMVSNLLQLNWTNEVLIGYSCRYWRMHQLTLSPRDISLEFKLGRQELRLIIFYATKICNHQTNDTDWHLFDCRLIILVDRTSFSFHLWK